MSGLARILVVDDEPDTLGLIELTLETAGYEVQTAPNGSQALRMLEEEYYDVVLLDVMMPDISGFDVLRTLRARSGEAPPVIFLTAKARPEDRDAGRGLGAVGYLIKPATRGQLLDMVQRALAKAEPDDAAD